MSPFQIVAIVILGLGVLTALGFTIAFIVVSCAKEKAQDEKDVSIDSQKEEINEIDLDQMLAKLEEASKTKEEEKTEEPVQVEEKAEEPAQVEEAKEEIKEEPKEPAQDNSKVVINIFGADVQKEPEDEEAEVTPVIVEETKEEKEEQPAEVVTVVDHAGPEFDYRIRLEKIKESQAKIDRDLDKTSRAILKYERTIRRMERNQKMLDRRALELTNLNLLMYSVTDIKNVDAEKKARQEELTSHIAELKASIQDAQEYIETNREKYESNLKLKDYLTHEQTRYADEVKELEALIAAGKFFDDGTDDTAGDKQ